MPVYALFFIPIYSILIAFLTFLSLIWYLNQRKNDFIKQMGSIYSPKINIPFLSENLDEGELESQIDDRLDQIISGFKRQIPMISMFLSKTKEEEMKGTARNELMKLIPAIKQGLMQKKGEMEDQGKSLEGKIGQQIDAFIQHFWEQGKRRLFLLVAGVGLLLGLLEVILIYLINVV